MARFLLRCLREFFGEKIRRRKSLLAIFLVVALPNFAVAQIVISEFLYDASGSDSGQEFVELFNAGNASVDLTGWKISDGSNHTLNAPPKNGGTGSIILAPGSYALIVDDAEAFLAAHRGVHGTVIDTVLNFNNSDGSVGITDADGTIVESISYTKDSGAAGDGNSLTRQSATDKIFVVATPSPGAGILSRSSPSSPIPDQPIAATSTDTSLQSGTVSQTVGPEPQLTVDAGDNRVVIVGSDVKFEGKAYTRKKEIVDSVDLVWNFGDGTTLRGRNVSHRFQYPGRYAVVAVVQNASLSASDKVIITAELPKLTLESLGDGSILIHNSANRDLDLSHWIVRQSGADFVFPDQSILLAGASIKLSNATLGFWSSPTAELLYPDGSPAAEPEPSNTETIPAAESNTIVLPPIQSAETRRETMPSTEAVPIDIDEDDVSQEDDTSSSPSATPSAQAAAAITAIPAESGGMGYMWWLSAFGVATLAAGSLVVARKFGKKEWDIVEEK
ncbi:hypothetical protein A2763_02130 [Candidatus Kaiserbacteria bacterium RIFCSPHIGHO2_01_FULL_54_36]|uniref:PKD domain-containing protein n=1 Tax=Candidatus Kaiserbacteria bacterium RIFCSPHIGHO2_01_FULL_54_36 TaxID=1798482 RepID=A0A1F6CPS7_9BACT|nr:MAG: hypothetical protein A2763_02130 [Candidatus Kaiserbacteria bacterium RIFCSPHIGHO2_01_FULL_54_36]OGG75906.1 MAG: hypothetical protein A3A41_04600 [Candidatus Kaiserbacteria bacterium RIFCSPLOWO2_01_FULL_54_22]